jgi:hypothetical protein
VRDGCWSLVSSESSLHTILTNDPFDLFHDLQIINDTLDRHLCTENIHKIFSILLSSQSVAAPGHSLTSPALT